MLFTTVYVHVAWAHGLTKIQKCLSQTFANVKFVTCYKTTKLFFFTNTKNKTAFISSVGYKFVWQTSFFSQLSVGHIFIFPSSSTNYICKTKRAFFEQIDQHVYPNILTLTYQFLDKFGDHNILSFC